MATSKEYLEFILDGLSKLDGITFRQMMGEYIIYYNERIAAYVCDNRLLVKPVLSAVKLMPNAVFKSPYEGSSKMLLVENTDDSNFLKILFEAIYDELPMPKNKRRK